MPLVGPLVVSLLLSLTAVAAPTPSAPPSPAAAITESARRPAASTLARTATPSGGLTALAASGSGLSLPFAPARVDYVVRCPDAQTVTLTGTVAAGAVVRARPLGPGASPPTTLRGSFSYPITAPGAVAVRLDATLAGSTTRYRVRCLPSTIPWPQATVTGTPQAAFYVVTHAGWDLVLDAEGTPVWWFDESPAGPVDAKIIDGRIVTTVPGGDYVFRRWDGTPVRTIPGLDHHDLQRLPGGQLMGFRYYDSGRGLTEEAELVAFDDDDRPIWTWRTEDHVATDESSPAAFKLTWGHVNSVETDGPERLLWGARNLDAMYDIDLATGQVLWKLGGTRTPQSLTVSDGTRDLTDAEVVNLLRGPHDARILDDGTVSVLDNGSSGLARRPRVLRFQLDLAARRATIVQTITDPRAGYSFGLGSARRLPGGDWVVHWGGFNDYFTELAPDGSPVLTVQGISTYRAVPVLAGEIDAEAMRQGMDDRAGSPSGLTGLVADPGGAPVGHAGVVVMRAGDLGIQRAVVADADGEWGAAVPPGDYFVYLLDSTGDHASGFHGAPTRVTVAAGAPADVASTMTATRGAITGTVRDVTSAAPVAGALAVALDAGTGAPLRAATAGGDGRFSLGPLDPGSYKLVALDGSGAHAAGFFDATPDPASATPVAVTAGATADVTIRLRAQAPATPASLVSGTVREGGTGRALRNVAVVAVRSSDVGLDAVGLTGADGRYQLAVGAGSHLLAIIDPAGAHATEWYDDQPYWGLAGATPVTGATPADVELAPTTGSFGGTVRARGTGEPLAGRWVLAIGPSGVAGGAVTATDGTYAIAGLRPGTYRAALLDPTGLAPVVFWPDATSFPGAQPFPVAAGARATVDATL